MDEVCDSWDVEEFTDYFGGVDGVDSTEVLLDGGVIFAAGEEVVCVLGDDGVDLFCGKVGGFGELDC